MGYLSSHSGLYKQKDPSTYTIRRNQENREVYKNCCCSFRKRQKIFFLYVLHTQDRSKTKPYAVCTIKKKKNCKNCSCYAYVERRQLTRRFVFLLWLINLKNLFEIIEQHFFLFLVLFVCDVNKCVYDLIIFDWINNSLPFIYFIYVYSLCVGNNNT